MRGEYLSWNGHIVAPDELEASVDELLTAHYIYRRVQVAAGMVLWLAEHLDAVRRALWDIHAIRPEFDAHVLARRTVELLRRNRYPEEGAATALLRFFPTGEDCDVLITCERPLVERGWTVSSLRPVAVSHSYRLPYEGFSTNFLLSVSRFYDTLALEHGATKSVRRDGDKLLTCGDAPLFGIHRRTLFTAPLCDGAVDGVERKMVIGAAAKAGLDFLEEAVPRSGLADFDELFYADAAGLTSLAECDGSKFMSLLVGRIVSASPK